MAEPDHLLSHAYLPWGELFRNGDFTEQGSKWVSNNPDLEAVHFSKGPEILPGWMLRLNVTNSGKVMTCYWKTPPIRPVVARQEPASVGSFVKAKQSTAQRKHLARRLEQNLPESQERRHTSRVGTRHKRLYGHAVPGEPNQCHMPYKRFCLARLFGRRGRSGRGRADDNLAATATGHNRAFPGVWRHRL